MSTRASTTNAYTRSAILTWANAILDSTHLTFQDIPCHDVGLLLYGIFHSAATSSHTSSNTNAKTTQDSNETSTSTIPLLTPAELHTHGAQHQQTCTRFLQLLQFPTHTTAASSSSTPSSATFHPAAAAASLSHPHAASVVSPSTHEKCGSGVTAVAQQRNAEHVLAMIRALSAEEAALLRTVEEAEQQRCNADAQSHRDGMGSVNAATTGVAGSTANVVLLLGPSMTPEAWLSGSAFVEELKLWRWVRLMADRHLCTVHGIRATIMEYLRQEGGDTSCDQTPQPPQMTKAAAPDVLVAPVQPTKKRPRDDADTSKQVKTSDTKDVQEEEEGVSNAYVEHNQSNTESGTSDTTPMDTSAVQKELKRARLEASPSPSPVPAPPSSMLLLNASVSPVHALVSPIRKADPDIAHEDGPSTLFTATSSVFTASAAAVRAAQAMHDATAATSTSFVAQIDPLQNTLHAAQQTMEQTFRSAALAPSNASSTHSSTGAATTTATAAEVEELISADASSATSRQPLLPAVANSGEGQEALCRQRMVRHVYPTSTSAKNSADGEAADVLTGGATAATTTVNDATLLTAPPSCAVCPAVMAHAIQCNLNAIDALEEARTKAIAACLKKDPVALLAALQNVV